ncbi:MAG: LytTR family DNA-binding domain-containing protein [Bacteroidota bacterium]
MKINCIAVDDEHPALMQIEDYISKVPFLNLLKSFDNGIETLEFLKSNTVDLIFLDIQMEDLTGIQLLSILKNKPRVILTTAYDSYALQAFDLDVTDYLLKPISFERFLQSVEKVFDSISPKKSTDITAGVTPTGDEKGYLFVKTDYRMKRVDFKDILYIEGLKEYLVIRTLTGKVITLQSFKKMEDALPSANFIRVHKSYMVAIDKIESIERNRIKIADQIIPVGDTYKKQFFDMLDKSGI